MTLVPREFFARATANIAAWGDTDVFPLPLENHVFHDKAPEAVDLLESMSSDIQSELSTNPPINHSALTPLGYTGFRWATQLDPIWNACFLGTVLSMAGNIEAVRIPEVEEVVFSHRYRETDPSDAAGTSTSLFDREGWSKFQEKSRSLAEDSTYVVTLDIADFYGRIYHHRLENQLRYVLPSGDQRVKNVMDMLMSFGGGVSYGLPVGGPAARILSELVLNSVDRLVRSQFANVRFVRYADDFRFFASSLEEAYSAIGYLSEKLQRNEGLALQRHKTRILTSSEFVSTLRPDEPRPGSAAKFLGLSLYFDPYSATADQDYEVLQDQLDEFDVLGLLRTELSKGRVDISLTRRLIGALKLMDSRVMQQAIFSLLDNLEVLTPVVPHVMRAIRDNVSSLDETAQAEVQVRVRNLITSNHQIAQVDVNLSYIVRVLAQFKCQENEDLLIRMFPGPHGYAQAPSPGIQHDIMLALGRWEANYWLHDQKQHFSTMHSWVKRAFIVSSFVMGDAGSHWRKGTRRTFSPFERLLSDWTADRKQSGSWEIPL